MSILSCLRFRKLYIHVISGILLVQLVQTLLVGSPLRGSKVIRQAIVIAGAAAGATVELKDVVEDVEAGFAVELEA